MSTEEAVFALNMAVKRCNHAIDKVFHSDQDVQYPTLKTCDLINSLKIILSISREGNCRNNAVAEGVFKTLKTKLIHGYRLISKEQMRLKLFLF